MSRARRAPCEIERQSPIDAHAQSTRFVRSREQRARVRVVRLGGTRQPLDGARQLRCVDRAGTRSTRTGTCIGTCTRIRTGTGTGTGALDEPRRQVKGAGRRAHLGGALKQRECHEALLRAPAGRLAARVEKQRQCQCGDRETGVGGALHECDKGGLVLVACGLRLGGGGSGSGRGRGGGRPIQIVEQTRAQCKLSQRDGQIHRDKDKMKEMRNKTMHTRSTAWNRIVSEFQSSAAKHAEAQAPESNDTSPHASPARADSVANSIARAASTAIDAVAADVVIDGTGAASSPTASASIATPTRCIHDMAAAPIALPAAWLRRADATASCASMPCARGRQRLNRASSPHASALPRLALWRRCETAAR